MAGTFDDTIEIKVIKDRNLIIRKLNRNLKYKSPNGQIKKFKGRSLLLIRNVGHLTTTPTILDSNKNEIGEGLIYSFLLSLMLSKNNKKILNSKFKSLYIVKPKMHGPDELKFPVNTLSSIEKLLSIPGKTIKIGIMNKERRTTLNLKECIREAKERVFLLIQDFWIEHATKFILQWNLV